MVKGNIFYKKMPCLIQNIFLTARGGLYNLLRQQRMFRKIFSELEYTQYLNQQEMIEWQKRKLFMLISHAYKNVPYYNKLFKKMRLCPEDIKDIKDLERLPILTKEDVRNNYLDLLAKDTPRYLIREVFTSGTSGKPLRLYRDLYSINFENALIWRQRKLAGIDFSDRLAVLREEDIVPFSIKRPPFWRYSIFEKKIFFSSYHLSRANISYYIKALEDFRPAAIEAEPSLLYILCKLIKSEGLIPYIPSLKAIFTSSEILVEKHKDFINRVFRVPMYDFYGCAERVVAIGMCELGNYHILPEAGISEFLPLKDGTNRFELIGTGLHNYAMPLIRYRVGDIIRPSTLLCNCGRRSQVVEKIEGRFSDFIITKDRRIGIDVPYLSLRGVNNIIESQIIQEGIDRIRVKFVPTTHFSRYDRDTIIDNIRAFMGDDTEVLFEPVASIFENRENKFRPFISKIEPEDFL